LHVEALQIASSAGVSEMPPYDRTPLTLFQIMQIAKVGPLLNSPQAAARLSTLLGLDLSPQSRVRQSTSDALWTAMQLGRIPLVSVPPAPAAAHTDAIVAVDSAGNVAAVVHTINTVNWGSTGIFVGGVSIPDSATFQQQTIAALTPGSRLPATTHPGMALKNGKPVLAFGSIGSGSQTRTLAALISVLGRGMTPQQAIDAPALGGFEYSPGPPPKFTGIVGIGEFDAAYIQAMRDLGQELKVDDAGRGYWVGVSIDPETAMLRAGTLREFPSSGGGAAAY
jgi:gamma-glutamyltranspeptidase/glutathione hydrolase